MKKLLIGLLMLAFAATTTAQEIPSQRETLGAMRRVNDYFMKKYADPTAVMPYFSRRKNYESNIWTLSLIHI